MYVQDNYPFNHSEAGGMQKQCMYKKCVVWDNYHIFNPLYSDGFSHTHIDTISMGLSIVHFKGPQVELKFS